MIKKNPLARNLSSITLSAIRPVNIHFLHPGIREQHSSELIMADLMDAKAELSDYIRGVQQIMFQATHKVRQPIANLLGLSNLLDQQYHTQAELKKITGYITQSISILDIFTRDLILFISNLANSKKE
ncbi:MAG: arcB [Bacteroidetes bacterium]|nr:arcB [Bacteroidota bacterium]